MTAHASTPAGALDQPVVHQSPLGLYIGIFAALMMLTALTVGAAMQDLGPFNTVVALAIACTKAVLVVLFFMHVRHSSRVVWAVVAGGFFWLILLLLMTLSDYITRGPGWLHYG